MIIIRLLGLSMRSQAVSTLLMRSTLWGREDAVDMGYRMWEAASILAANRPLRY